MSDAYLGLREQALHFTAATAKAELSMAADQPFGTVTDIGFPNATVTVVALRDGSASIYASAGGGMIGGGGQPRVHAAALVAVRAAKRALAGMHATTEFPLPKPDDVNFYVLTNKGVFTATSAESELKDASTPLGSLYDAVQGVVTQFRLTQPR